jgi:hypothetical protein
MIKDDKEANEEIAHFPVGLEGSDDEEDVEPSWPRHDAIPKNGIWFEDALVAIFSNIESSVQFGNRFATDWAAVLQRSRDFEKNAGHDPRTFDSEFEEEWHKQKQANLFLRLAIEDREVTACCTHPRSGDIFQFHSDGWIPSQWLECLDEEKSNPKAALPEMIDWIGPEKRLMDGEERHVFFLKEEFGVWFLQTLGKELPEDGASRKLQFSNQQKALRLVHKACKALWPETLWPGPGMTEADRLDAINNWLEVHEKRKVSTGSVKNFFAELRALGPSPT